MPCKLIGIHSSMVIHRG